MEQGLSAAGVLLSRKPKEERLCCLMLMLGVTGGYRCTERQAGLNNEKINMIWASRSCQHFMKMMLYVSHEKEVTSRSREIVAPCCGVIGASACGLQQRG